MELKTKIAMFCLYLYLYITHRQISSKKQQQQQQQKCTEFQQQKKTLT